jgi:hypothetical protein
MQRREPINPELTGKWLNLSKKYRLNMNEKTNS